MISFCYDDITFSVVPSRNLEINGLDSRSDNFAFSAMCGIQREAKNNVMYNFNTQSTI